jgi:hypothetical protein
VAGDHPQLKVLTPAWCAVVLEETARLPLLPGATGDIEFAVRYPPGVTTSVTVRLSEGQAADVFLGPSPRPHLRMEYELEDFAAYLREGNDAVHGAYMRGHMRTTGDLDTVIALAPLLDSDEYAAALRRVHDETDFG